MGVLLHMCMHYCIDCDPATFASLNCVLQAFQCVLSVKVGRQSNRKRGVCGFIKILTLPHDEILFTQQSAVIIQTNSMFDVGMAGN